ncbi:MAG: hypothetical protein UIM26_09315 [Longicatena sp.]|nr:hypothetical protein [Longicatena sp.]
MICYPIKPAFYELAKANIDKIHLLLELDHKQKAMIFEKIDQHQIQEAYFRLYDIQLQVNNNKLIYYNEYQNSNEILEVYSCYVIIKESGKNILTLLQRLYPNLIWVEN